MNSSFKVTYAISGNCRFYFPWRNRTLSVWDSKLSCHTEVPWSFKFVNWKCGVFMFTLASRVNSGEANSVCRSLLVDFFCWPSTYFLVSISARTNSFHSTFSKEKPFWTMQHNFWNKLVQSKAKCDVSGPSERSICRSGLQNMGRSGTNQNAPFPSWTRKPYNKWGIGWPKDGSLRHSTGQTS